MLGETLGEDVFKVLEAGPSSIQLIQVTQLVRVIVQS